MKVIYNKIIPFKGYKCINLFGVLFVRKGCTMRESDYNHEAIHTKQMKDFCMFRFTFCIFWNGCTGLHKKVMRIGIYRLRRKPMITRTTWITLIKENIFLGLNTFEFYIYE